MFDTSDQSVAEYWLKGVEEVDGKDRVYFGDGKVVSLEEIFDVEAVIFDGAICVHHGEEHMDDIVPVAPIGFDLDLCLWG